MQGLPRQFEPLMTLYLTDRTALADIRQAAQAEFVHAVKAVPAGATTNSAAGVAHLEALHPTFAAMEEADLPLLVHGESPTPRWIFSTARRCSSIATWPYRAALPGLRVVLEHITTAMQWASCVRRASAWRRPSPPTTCCSTATTCWSVASAPTTTAACPCSSAISTRRPAGGRDLRAPRASSWVRIPPPQHRQQGNQLWLRRGIQRPQCHRTVCGGVCGSGERSTGWRTCLHFGGFYRLPRNADTITLAPGSWQVPASCPGRGLPHPLRAGETVAWRVLDQGGDS